MSTSHPGSPGRSEQPYSRVNAARPENGSGPPPDWLMNLDEPSEGQVFATGEVFVRGWVSDLTGSPSISAKVGELPWVDVPYGKSRTDVGKAHPNRPSAGTSGFGRRIDVGSLPPGKYDFVLKFRRPSGAVVEVRRELRIADRSRMIREAIVNLPGDALRLKLEQPVEDSPILRGSVLKLSGWALAKTGLDRIEVWIDGQGPHLATHGLMREEISALYDDFPEASHAGFLWTWQTSQLPPGSHSLLVRAYSKSANVVEVQANFEIDQRSEYELWAGVNVPSRDQLLALHEESDKFAYAPRISIITPVFRTPEAFLRKCVDSVRKQVYPHWELILVDDCSGDRRLSSILQSFAEEDRRIRVRTLPSNLGIAGATNAGLEMCRGEYVGLLDHDDEISADALFRVVEALNKDNSLDILYSDEDKIDTAGNHQDGFFKPDWSPDLLLSMNYVCHFLVCRRSLLREVGGLRLGFDGSQDYDLILRLSEKSQKIKRIPKVLYHWRIHDQSTASGVDVKPAASDAGRRAIEAHLERKGVAASVFELGPGRYRVKYKIADQPEVAIIIPTGGSKTLPAALESIRAKTTYRNYRIVVVDNSRSDTPKQTVETFRAKGQSVDLVDCRGLTFNFSLLCNRAAAAVDSPYLLFLNDDTSVITPEWIECMLEHAQRSEVGAVGAQLLFPNDTIQHAGVVTGLFEAAGHPFRGMPDKPFYFDFSHVIRNCAAVTGACLMTRRDVFDSVGGYDEPNLPTCFQDVDLCLKMVEKGYRIVYTPFARLYHHESFSKKSVAELPEINFMKERWQSFIADDPFYNPNLTRRSDDFSLNYDYLFASHAQKMEPSSASGLAERSVAPAVDTQAARRVSRLGKIEFYASPNPAKPVKRGLGQTTLHWSVPGSDKIQVRVGSPRGPLFAEGGSQGKSATGPWVESGTVFYLQDATESDPSSPDCVLATARVMVIPLTKATSAH